MSTSQPRLRSLRGCWTCRLRRKKCDETKPVCSTCSALEISCLYSEVKPKWMDGGSREKEKAQEVKRIIKERASERRDRKWAVLLNPDAAKQQDHHGVEEDGEGGGKGMMRGTSAESEGSVHGGLQNMGLLQSAISLGERGGPMLPTPDMSPGDLTMGQDSYEQTREISMEAGGELGLWGTNPAPEAGPSAQESGYKPALSSSWFDTSPLSSSNPQQQPHLQSQPQPQLQESNLADIDATLERETGAIMTYLDHALPYFHPFYHPPLITGSRGWQLFLLLKNKTIFHTALSLSSYFLSVAFHASRNNPVLESQTHRACQMASWADLLRHQDLAIRRLRDDVQSLGEGTGVHEGIRAVVGIVQLLEFEIVIANRPGLGSGIDDDEDEGASDGKKSTSSWLPHLNAALELFGQIMDREGRKEEEHRHQQQQQQNPDYQMGNEASGVASWQAITKQMSYTSTRASGMSMPLPPSFKPPLSNAEMALHFNTARLLYIDIVAATSLERSPLLSKYHAEILGGPKPAIKLEQYVGLQNWVVLATAQVVDLAVWKRQMKSSGQLSVVELVKRASKIEGDLRRGLHGLSGVVDSALRAAGYVNSCLAVISGQDPMTLDNDPSVNSNTTTNGSVRSYPTPPPPNTTHTAGSTYTQSGPQPPVDVAIHTTLWAHGTLIYLALSVSGMQPQTPEIQASLQSILTLFTSFCPLSPSSSSSTPPVQQQQQQQPGPSPSSGSCRDHNSSSVTTTLHLRTVMWPFVIAGIVTTRAEQKEIFPRLVGGMGELSIFGSAREALRVVRRVWERRDGCKKAGAGVCGGGGGGGGGFMDAEDWSVAGCLNILGRPSLLV